MAAPKGHPRYGGRQKGTPNKATADLKELAQEYTGEAVEKLVFWMRSDNPTASTHAAAMLLDRGYGKPRQQIEHDAGPNTIDLLTIIHDSGLE